MANEYRSPNYYYDYSGSWSGEGYAYDGDTASPASTSIPAKSWSNFLELILYLGYGNFVTPLYCSKIKFFARYDPERGVSSIDLDIYYYDSITGIGAWHDVYEGSFLNQVWVEKVLFETYYATKVRVRFYNNSSNIATGGIQELMFYETVGKPTVETFPATLVEDDEATLNGSIIITGGAACTVRGFEYKEGIDGTVYYAYDSGAYDVGDYSKALTGLDPTKKYYFRAYATNSAGTGYGAWKSFGIDVSAPTVTTNTATGENEDSATLNGNITTTGGQDCEERGFQYKVGLTGEVIDLPETGNFGIGAFTGALTNLENFTEYYFRAYAKNGAGTAYGSWLTFNTTIANPTVKTHSATEILTTQAKLNGEIVKTGGIDCNERGFEYGLTKSAENTIKDEVGGYGVGFFDKTPTGLSPNTKYWYRAFASYALTIEGVYFGVHDQDNQPQNITFSSDGTKIYFIGYEHDTVFQYTLSIPYDITTMIYNDKYKSVTTEDIYPRGLAFSTDGTKMYIAGQYSQKVYQYTLSTPWDVSTATYDSVNFVVYYTAPYSIVFSTDGMKMYILENGTYKLVYQYTLTTPWDISTTVAYVPDQHINIATQEQDPYSIFFNSDGTKLYFIGTVNNTVYQYTLSTPWDVTTGTYSGKFKSVVAQDISVLGIAFNSDGTKMYIVGSNTDKVYPYTLSEPWDVSTATYDVIYSDIATGYGEWLSFMTAAPGGKPSGYKNDICSDYNGYTYILNRSLTDDGADYESYFVLSTDLSGKQTLHTNKRLLDIFSYFANKGTGTAKIYVKCDTEPEWQYAGEVSLTGEKEIIIKHLPSENEDSVGDVDFLAKHFLVRFVFWNDFEFIGMITEAVPIGDR